MVDYDTFTAYYGKFTLNFGYICWNFRLDLEFDKIYDSILMIN